MKKKIQFFAILIFCFSINSINAEVLKKQAKNYAFTNPTYDIKQTVSNLITYLKEYFATKTEDFFNETPNEYFSIALCSLEQEAERRSNNSFSYSNFQDFFNYFKECLNIMPNPFRNISKKTIQTLLKIKYQNQLNNQSINKSHLNTSSNSTFSSHNSIQKIQQIFNHMMEYLTFNGEETIKKYFSNCTDIELNIIFVIITKEAFRRTLNVKQDNTEQQEMIDDYMSNLKSNYLNLDTITIKDIINVYNETCDNNVDKLFDLESYKPEKANEFIKDYNNQTGPFSPKKNPAPLKSNPPTKMTSPQKIFGIDSTQEKPLDKNLQINTLQQANKEIITIIRQLIFGDPESTFFPKQMLLVGKPGTGKTTLAKTIALQSGRKYRYIEAPELLTKFQFSGSENLIATINDVIAKNEPYVIIIDEITSLTDRFHNNGFADKETSAALWLALDKCADNPNIIFIGIANDIKKIPPQLKSRFQDAIIEITPPSLHARSNTIEYYIQCEQNVITHKNFNIKKIAQRTKGFTVRELQRLVRKALLSAYMEDNQKIFVLENKHFDKALKILKKKKSLFTDNWSIKARDFAKASFPYILPIIATATSIYLQYLLNKKSQEHWFQCQKA